MEKVLKISVASGFAFRFGNSWMNVRSKQIVQVHLFVYYSVCDFRSGQSGERKCDEKYFCKIARWLVGVRLWLVLFVLRCLLCALVVVPFDVPHFSQTTICALGLFLINDSDCVTQITFCEHKFSVRACEPLLRHDFNYQQMYQKIY